MNNLNTQTNEKITGGEIKIVAWVLATAILITFFFYSIPIFYNNFTLKNNYSEGIKNTANESAATNVNTITPPSVNI